MGVRINEAREKRGIAELDDFSTWGNACGGAHAGDFARR